MEQALKERLAGAVVLVGIAVLLIPELLSGRKPSVAADSAADGARTYTIELLPPGSNAPAGVEPGPEAAAREPSPALTLPAPTDETTDEIADESGGIPAAEPGVAAAAKAGAEASSQPVSPAARGPAGQNPPQPGPEPVASSDDPTAGAVATPGGLAVQVGAFGSEDAANRLVRELQSKGFDAYLSPVERGGKMLQRVRVGPAPDAATAAATAERLKQQGYASAVVVGT
jgi:cell division septation protein DedD